MRTSKTTWMGHGVEPIKSRIQHRLRIHRYARTKSLGSIDRQNMLRDHDFTENRQYLACSRYGNTRKGIDAHVSRFSVGSRFHRRPEESKGNGGQNTPYRNRVGGNIILNGPGGRYWSCVMLKTPEIKLTRSCRQDAKGPSAVPTGYISSFFVSWTAHFSGLWVFTRYRCTLPLSNPRYTKYPLFDRCFRCCCRSLMIFVWNGLWIDSKSHLLRGHSRVVA